MTPQDLFYALVIRALVLTPPLAVGVLAFRRLVMSRTSNIWVYALAAGYALFSVIGLLPWAMGLQAVSASFLVLSALCPLVWLVIVTVCGIGRPSHYHLDNASQSLADIDYETAPEPLLLTNPIVEEIVPVFRHHLGSPARRGGGGGMLLQVARSMRGRDTSDPRRVRKLLPPPAPEARDLPFVR